MRMVATIRTVVGIAVLLSGCSLVTDVSPGQLVNDVSTTTTLKSRLATTEGLGSLANVHVRTVNDMVYLTGTVRDEATRERIEKLARRVAGDNRVTDQLQIEGEPSQARAVRRRRAIPR